MGTYPTIRNALSMFSVETGLDEQAARRALVSSMENPEWYASLRDELERLAHDSGRLATELIANEEYEVDEAADDEEAWSIVLDLLWQPVFPGRARPVRRDQS